MHQLFQQRAEIRGCFVLRFACLFLMRSRSSVKLREHLGPRFVNMASGDFGDNFRRDAELLNQRAESLFHLFSVIQSLI